MAVVAEQSRQSEDLIADNYKKIVSRAMQWVRKGIMDPHHVQTAYLQLGDTFLRITDASVYRGSFGLVHSAGELDHGLRIDRVKFQSDRYIQLPPEELPRSARLVNNQTVSKLGEENLDHVSGLFSALNLAHQVDGSGYLEGVRQAMGGH
jgi:hypothetical protein